MSRFHRIRRTELGGMWPGEFFSLAGLLFAYDGAVVGRHEKLKQEAKEAAESEANEARFVSGGLIERG